VGEGMASELIQYLRLMIDAYLYDGAWQTEQEAEPYQIEATTVKDAFLEAMRSLNQRKKRDDELVQFVENATRQTAKQLNEAILLNANELRYDDQQLLDECRGLVYPERGPLSMHDVGEIWDWWRARAAKDAEEAAQWGVDVEDLPRVKALSNALVQDAEVILLRYMLVRIARCRKDELYQDMLKLNRLHEPERYAFKRTVREAFLCRVFGFDQAAAALCGAALEAEVTDRLESIGAIRRIPGRWPIALLDGEELPPSRLLQEAHSKNLFGENDEANTAVYQKADKILELRNSALHDPTLFIESLREEPPDESFVLCTREVLEAIQ